MLVHAFATFNRSADKLREAYKQLSRIQDPESGMRDPMDRRYYPDRSICSRLLVGALEQMTSGVIVTDRTCRIIVFNTAAQELTGLSANDAIGEFYQDVFSGQPPEPGRHLRCFPGGVEAEVCTMPIMDDDGNIIGTAEEILGQDRQKSRAAQVSSELPPHVTKLIAVVGDIIINIAHRMRSPLSAIQIFAELLKQDLDEDKQGMVDDILVGVHSLDAVLSNLLSFSQPVNPHLQEVDIVAILDESLLFAMPAIKQQGISLIRKYPHNRLSCYGDLEQLKQVCFNLILNAIQAMPEGGELHIRAYDDAEHIRIEIEDYGCGIPDESMDRIFTPFFTTKEDGTGLGLYVVYRVIQAHQGTVEVDSTPGRGTKVLIRLPKKT